MKVVGGMIKPTSLEWKDDRTQKLNDGIKISE